jgi:hypothetical protein
MRRRAFQNKVEQVMAHPMRKIDAHVREQDGRSHIGRHRKPHAAGRVVAPWTMKSRYDIS